MRSLKYKKLSLASWKCKKSLSVIFSLRLKRKSFEIFLFWLKLLYIWSFLSLHTQQLTQIFPILVTDWILCFPPLLNHKAFALEASCKWLLGVSLGCLKKKKKRIPFLINRWGNSGNSGWLYFSGLWNHCRWWLQSWN